MSRLPATAGREVRCREDPLGRQEGREFTVTVLDCHMWLNFELSFPLLLKMGVVLEELGQHRPPP